MTALPFTEAKALTEHVTKKAIALIRALHNTNIGATEFQGGYQQERPDAILFKTLESFLIETKISRADFLRDFKKPFRAKGRGIGKYRYFACPTGLIKPEELPEKWGLIYVEPGNKRATMPVGFGGAIQIGTQKHPKHGWTDPIYQFFGSFIGDKKEGFWHTERRQSKAFSFNNRDIELEAQYIFALATRYKTQKFMENLL